MKKSTLNILTIIAFLLIPVLALIRLNYHAPTLDYGDGQITLNSVLLLMFGIYAFFVSTGNFVRAHRSWKAGKPQWKAHDAVAYFCTLVFSVSLAFLMMFDTNRCFPEYFLFCLRIVSPAFLLPVGFVLLTLGINGLFYSKTRPKAYLIITFLAFVPFTFGGVIPAFLVGLFWLTGGLSL
jgi:hypothetical protein